MRLPLFVAAKPAVGMKSPKVFLREGSWKPHQIGDAEFSLSLESLEIPSGGLHVEATILSVGKSPLLSLYLDNGID